MRTAVVRPALVRPAVVRTVAAHRPPHTAVIMTIARPDREPPATMEPGAVGVASVVGMVGAVRRSPAQTGRTSVSNGPGERRIALPGAVNLRDVGGYPAAGGRVTRWRTLLRSGSLRRSGADGAAVLAGFGLHTVLDLRTWAESERSPDPVIEGARRAWVGLLGEDLAALPPRLGDIYRFTISERGAQLGAAVRELCAPAALPALVHCSAGKDRTGLVIALILSAVGVPDEVVAADYGLSAAALGSLAPSAVGELQAVAAEAGSAAGEGETAEDELLASPPELVLDVLAQVRASDGGAAGYLVRNGVAPAGLSVLRDRLTVAQY